MATILIIGIPNDAHTIAVEWGLAQLGVDTAVWMPSDLPDVCTVSVELDPATGSHHVYSRHQGVERTLSDVALIWNRRRDNPRAPAEAAPFDVDAIETETLEHSRNALFYLTDLIPSVNSARSQMLANRKALQLVTAIELGFNVPPTLFSNDMQRMQRFYEAHQPLIFKPHRPHIWVDGEGELSQLTANMPPPEEWSRETVEFCPMILQKKINRKIEVRVTIFGDNVVAAKTLGAGPLLMLDAREAVVRDRFESFEQVALPPGLEQQCRAYMKRFELEFGAFDFIVDDGDVWHFLECNEAGQFLFKEAILPDTLMLDRFCRWLIARAGLSCTRRDHEPITWYEFEAAEEVDIIRARQEHHKVPIGLIPAVYEH